MNPLRRLATAALVALAFVSHAVPHAAATTIWNESVNGPLSTDPASPTPLTVGVGSNSIIATIGGANRDYFSFTLAPGQSLESFLLASYASSDAVSWIGLQAGASWTAGDNVGSMISQQHFGTANVGTNLLGITSTEPLTAGTYTVRAQQAGTTTAYQFDLAVVPEPSTYAIALAGLACGGYSMWRRRKPA
ncbi:MAG: PEP-CTERM sorting domain-containing protein [Planctomycetota bacterium]